MTFEQTKANLAVDLTPQSGDHWVRLVFSAVITAAGIFVVVVQCLRHELGWIGPLMVFGGVGVMFTKTVVALAKALLPFKSRNGQ